MARTMDERSLKIYNLVATNNINEAALEALDECKKQIEAITYKNYKRPTKQQTDDINQLCYEELHRIVKNYDPERGTKFITYSECYLKSIITKYFKNNVYKQMNTFPCEYYKLPAKRIETTFYVFPEHKFSMESREMISTLYSSIERLSPKRREVINLYYGFNQEPINNLEEIARLLGMSPSTARVTKRKAELQLKKFILEAA